MTVDQLVKGQLLQKQIIDLNDVIADVTDKETQILYQRSDAHREDSRDFPEEVQELCRAAALKALNDHMDLLKVEFSQL